MADVARIAPLIAVTRDGGEGRTSLTRAGRVRLDYRLDASGVATLRHALVRMARIARAAGALEQVAVGTPPVWHRTDRGDPGRERPAFDRLRGRPRAGSTSRRTAGRSSRPTRWGPLGIGRRPADHPADPWGRVRVDARGDRAIGGLYVGDGSLFPTGLGVNPMITIMALARRIARTILAESPAG